MQGAVALSVQSEQGGTARVATRQLVTGGPCWPALSSPYCGQRGAWISHPQLWARDTPGRYGKEVGEHGRAWTDGAVLPTGRPVTGPRCGVAGRGARRGATVGQWRSLAAIKSKT